MKRLSRHLRPLAPGMLTLGLLVMGLSSSYSAVTAEPTVTLEKIMSHPSWIGTWPTEVRFAPGGDSILILRHKSTRGDEVVEIDGDGKTLALHDTGQLPAKESRLGGSTLYEWMGDLFLTTAKGRQRLTRTTTEEAEPRWLSPSRFVYRGVEGPVVRELSTGASSELALIASKDAPEEAETFVQNQQDRLFPLLKERQETEEAQRAALGIPTLYLGADQELFRAEVTPDQRYLLVCLGKASKAKQDEMPNYLTRDGYVKTEDLRVKVGDDPAIDQRLLVYDLANKGQGAPAAVSYAGLPTWHEGRAVRVEDAKWSGNGRLALMLMSTDYEDRWLVEMDFAHAQLRLVEHLHDDAWHSWDLNEFGWTADGKALWYQSEKTGYAHLYLWDGATSRALTNGSFEATSVRPSPDGRYLYYRANRQRPSQYDIFRVDRSGTTEQITTLGGNTGYDLSSDGAQVVFLHSTIDHPPEVYLQQATPGAKARQVTHTTTTEFEAIAWTVPQIVAVPSTHHVRPVPAKLYLPKGGAQPGGPAVLFVHGAGYLQNSDEAWSYYFHEFMFHTLLNDLGVTVLDMDYRASAGYGRDWRTAIYRQMGTPELEDLEDGVAYLVAKQGVAADRIGIYGGSYGGFMTLMALFKDSDLFACGAALRPVTDWAQYENDYTARILNTPAEDPESYLRSSPIEFAEGLRKPLLIAHGMLDDNVVVQDSVRLSQRLILLEKQDWEVALYPVEAHGFIEPSSWLDEYRRILKLFKTHLKL